MSAAIPRPIVCVAALALSAALSACSPDAEDATFSPQELESASEFQRRMFSDGEITADEYRQAVMAERDCVAEAGYEVTPIVASGSLLSFDSRADYTNAADPEEADRQFLETTQQCFDEYTKYVGYAWSSSQVVPDGPARDEMRNKLAQCLRDAGADVELNIAEEDLLPTLDSALAAASGDELDSIHECLTEFGDLFIAQPEQ